MTSPTWLPGDPVPDFAVRSSNSERFHFNTAAGRYIVLSFFGSAGRDALDERRLVGRVRQQHRQPEAVDQLGLSMLETQADGLLVHVRPGVDLAPVQQLVAVRDQDLGVAGDVAAVVRNRYTCADPGQKEILAFHHKLQVFYCQ